MRTRHLVAILVLLALALPAAPAHAGGVVTVCDEAHLLAALAGGGTVTFACSGTIALTATITIATDTAMDGSGQTVIISGNNARRVFHVNPGTTLNLNRLTISNGKDCGEAINNFGTLTVNNSIISDNRNTGIFNGVGHRAIVSNSTFSGNSANCGGGGIYNQGDAVTVSNSTFVGNGRGIYNYSMLTVSNSTFSINSTGEGGTGGGIFNYLGTVTVSNSTFSGNSAPDGGGGIYNSGTLTLKNTIVADNPVGGNCYGTIIDGGGNLSYPDTTCPGINADPKLGPLQDNGGPTWTMALGPGSAAIDAANDATCAADPVNNLDQRGVSRPQGPHCDIGAYEHQVFALWRWFPFAPVR